MLFSFISSATPENYFCIRHWQQRHTVLQKKWNRKISRCRAFLSIGCIFFLSCGSLLSSVDSLWLHILAVGLCDPRWTRNARSSSWFGPMAGWQCFWSASLCLLVSSPVLLPWQHFLWIRVLTSPPWDTAWSQANRAGRAPSGELCLPRWRRRRWDRTNERRSAPSVQLESFSGAGDDFNGREHDFLWFWQLRRCSGTWGKSLSE